MVKFQHRPVTQKTINLRKPLYGIAINDADYHTAYRDSSGKKVKCPYHVAWVNMMQRCYSSKYHKRQPAYVGCSVCPEWHLFSGFREWMSKQNWRGMQLDKDIIHIGNKEYSPGSCCFIPSSLNKLLVNCTQSPGPYLLGVYKNSRASTFSATCRVEGVSIHLGSFKTEEEAHHTYCKFKSLRIQAIADSETDLRIQRGLRIQAAMLLFT